jgi:hypothetical protein
MFTSLKAELGRRSLQVAAFWRLIANLESEELSRNQSEPSLRTLKGLIFVHFYAIYEYVVIQSFASAVRQFNSHALTHGQIKHSLLAIGFKNRFMAIGALSERKAWLPKIDLLCATASTAVLSLPEDAFPLDESHFRQQQLDTICNVLDLPSGALLPDNRTIGWIREVVENRNAIAHGRETAESVGSRYSSTDLDIRRAQLDQLCYHIIATLENHCLLASNFVR